MGARKLTYDFNPSPMRVVYKSSNRNEKSVQRFLSIDPLATQAPGWTPYRYAFDNPVIFLDPNGMFEDNYYISKDVNVKIEKNDDNHDYIYIEGENKNNPIKLEKGELQYAWEYNNYIKGENKYEVLEFNSNSLANKIFERIANQSKVEWSFIATKIGSSQNGFLTSSGDGGTEGASRELYFRKLYKAIIKF